VKYEIYKLTAKAFIILISNEIGFRMVNAYEFLNLLCFPVAERLQFALQKDYVGYRLLAITPWER
jgi:hypothetical protein